MEKLKLQILNHLIEKDARSFSIDITEFVLGKIKKGNSVSQVNSVMQSLSNSGFIQGRWEVQKINGTSGNEITLINALIKERGESHVERIQAKKRENRYKAISIFLVLFGLFMTLYSTFIKTNNQVEIEWVKDSIGSHRKRIESLDKHLHFLQENLRSFRADTKNSSLELHPDLKTKRQKDSLNP